MSLENLERNLGELLTVIDLCLRETHHLPGLILLYSHIDIVASLNRPLSKDRVTREDFKKWVNDYLLPSSTLCCSADDLYAARCGLVHSYMAEADDTRSGKAKEIYYAWGQAENTVLERHLQESGLTNVIVINVDRLFEALCAGLHRFMEALSKDSQKEQLVNERAGKFFSNISTKQLEEIK